MESVTPNIFSSLLLLLYVVSVILTILLSFLVLFQDKKSATNIIYFFLSMCMALWLTATFLQGTPALQNYILLIHRLGIFFAAPLSASFFLFAHTFPSKKILLSRFSLISIIVLTLIVMGLNVSMYAFTGLETGGINPTTGWGIIPFALLSTFFSLGAMFLLVHRFFSLKKNEKKQLKLVILGIFLMLILIIITILIPILLFNSIAFVPLIPLYTLIFLSLTAYAITKYQLFHVRLLITQALTVTISIVLFAKIIGDDNPNMKVTDVFVFLVFSIFGILLIRSVAREVKQREEIEKLAQRLKKANKRLRQLDQMKSEFVSIASHQLRSPLTSIRGYTSMLLEGSFGKLPKKASEALDRIEQSCRFMAESVEDYLNVSRIQAGNMKYEMIDFNIKDEASRIVDDIRQQSMKKGLLLTFKSDMDKQGIVNADIGKVQQILHNLIDNALKYTPKGTIKVFVHDEVKQKKVCVDIIDSGIGMSKETLSDIFEKFERAHNANEVNVTGTGLGLYVARNMARNMGGNVTAFSNGEGEGSTFSLQLPLKM